jgi:hypothetical protein
MTTQIKPLNDITTEAIHVLCKEIGVANTLRFLNQFTTGYGNYTEERDALFGDLTVSEIVSEIHKMRKR